MIVKIEINQSKKLNIPNPGIEPGLPGWKPDVLTTRLIRIDIRHWHDLSIVRMLYKLYRLCTDNPNFV